MKLSDPRTIQSNLSEQRRVDIDNGIKLARQVDGLRNEALKREQELMTFREVTTKAVQSEIDSKIKERDILVSEITALEKERKELLEPLDKEWALVKEERDELAEITKKANIIFNANTDEIGILAKERELIAIEIKRQEDKKKQIDASAEQAHNILLEAQKRFTEVLEEEKRVALDVRNKTRKMNEKEAVLRATVDSIETREKEIEAEKEFISKEKIKLTDMRGTLERAMARIK